MLSLLYQEYCMGETSNSIAALGVGERCLSLAKHLYEPLHGNEYFNSQNAQPTLSEPYRASRDPNPVVNHWLPR